MDKKIFVGIIIFALFLVNGGYASASTDQSTNQIRASIQERVQTTREMVDQKLLQFQSATSSRQQERVQNLREYIQKLIQRRQEVLLKLKNRISTYESLSDEEKTEMRERLMIAETAMSQLLVRVNTEENLDVLKNRAEEVFQNRIFPSVVAKIRLQAMTEKMNEVLFRLNGMTEQLKNAIERLEENHLNNTGLKEQVVKYKGLILIARNSYNNSVRLTESLIEENIDHAQVFADAKNEARNCHNAIKQAFQLAKDMVLQIKELNN